MNEGDTMHSNAMQCNAMQCNAMQCNAMQCNVRQDKTRQDKTRQDNTRRDETVRYDTIRCDAMQYNNDLYINLRRSCDGTYEVRLEFRRPCGRRAGRRIHRSPTENYSARFVNYLIWCGRPSDTFSSLWTAFTL